MEGFIAQFAVVAEQYDIEVIEYRCDPRSQYALQNLYPDWPPTIGQVRAAFEEEKQKRINVNASAWTKQPRWVPPPLPNYPGCRCNLFVHAAAPQYPTVKAWSESPDADPRDWLIGSDPPGAHDTHGAPGMWVSFRVYNDIAGGRVTGFKTPSYAEQLVKIGQAEAQADKERKNDPRR